MRSAGMDRPWQLGQAACALWRAEESRVFATSQARHALTLILSVLRRRGVSRPVIWIPGYFCESGLGPLRKSGAKLHFFPVTLDLTPDWDGCRAMLAAGPPDLFILPHYFGVENEAAAARAFCDEHGALLQEDAAHVLLPVGAIGRYGDFVSYSPHKYVDVPDGGITVARSEALSAEADAAAEALSAEAASPWRWAGERIRQSLRRRHRRGPLRALRIDDEPGPDFDVPQIWMSKFARRRMARVGPADIAKISMREARVAAAFDHVARRFGLSPLPRHSDATPYHVAYRAAGADSAQDAFAALRRAGAIVNTWPGLPPEIWAEPHRYGAALDIRRTLLRFTPRPVDGRRPLDFLDQMPAIEAV